MRKSSTNHRKPRPINNADGMEYAQHIHKAYQSGQISEQARDDALGSKYIKNGQKETNKNKNTQKESR